MRCRATCEHSRCRQRWRSDRRQDRRMKLRRSAELQYAQTIAQKMLA